MKKVAVFGNAGGGKSTLSRKLSEMTNLPLYVLDKIQYKPGGVPISYEDYKQIHEEIISKDEWVIDGFGSFETVWLRLEKADTLVYVDLPLTVHFWWITKRLLTGFFVPPKGWPENSPLWKSSMNSYNNLWLCHQRLTPRYRDYVLEVGKSKKVYHLKSTKDIKDFYKLIP
ncbi:adenylate kinase [Cyanothece sp. BG0011]|uniref:adenylate kinase n=1 Tax=Cyanothece sp. BG0011 TaxID=2082950 RepID=UPI000D1EF7B9|nr:adenylate kinase [Cyanothece sp. BG0011]